MIGFMLFFLVTLLMTVPWPRDTRTTGPGVAVLVEPAFEAVALRGERSRATPSRERADASSLSPASSSSSSSESL